MIMHRWCFLFLTGVVWALSTNTLAAGACESWVARIVSVEGRVDVKHAGQTLWQPVHSNAIFCADDSLRVGALSRAAIEFHQETNLLRLDQHTVVTFSQTRAKSASWIELLKGAVYFISRIPHSVNIRVEKGLTNLAVEGTEFMVRAEPERAMVWVFEGQVSVSNELGRLAVAGGEAAIVRAGEAPRQHLVFRPRDAVQWALYYPPLIDYHTATSQVGPGDKTIEAALDRSRQGDLPGAFARLDDIPADLRDAAYFSLRAGLFLSVGRVGEAHTDVQRALNLDANHGTAYALQSVISTVQNEKEKALDIALQAIELDPESPAPRIALSYVQQANFEIEKARDSVQQAVNLAPGDALAWARLAELWLSLGDLDRALDAAREAVARNPDLARTQTVMGFSFLARFEIDDAATAFGNAIGLDQADPLPRLGLGLAKIRRSELEEGRREIEIAASLDPNNSLIRSYLGKAYFEEKRDDLAGTEYALAKELDPKDPTPWYYDAIRKQLDNRPVEALGDVEQALEFNDHRAVYRSRLLLDQDLATRGVSQARIYDDLGFDQVALAETSKSLSIDASNHSAHRFLSDTYAQLPRHEIARASELLQAQLLQPINTNPVQPRLAVTDLNAVRGIGPAEAAFNEFTPLFERNQARLMATGLAGYNGTFGDEVVVSGLYDRFSYSLGRFHSQTEGFRDNNDVDNDIYDVFGQIAPTPDISFQGEYIRRETEQGDLNLNFDLEDFSDRNRRKLNEDTGRLGMRISTSSISDVIASIVYVSGKEEVFEVDDFSEATVNSKERGYQIEAQNLYRDVDFNLITGFGLYDADVDEVINGTSIFGSFDISSSFEKKQQTAYVYTNVQLHKDLMGTFGINYDEYQEDEFNVDNINPKLGLQWQINDGLRLRLAGFRTVKRALAFHRTIEPTQIAGFNQFFDDINGSRTERFGIAVDGKLSATLYGGLELSRRDLDVPINRGDTIEEWRDDLYRAYINWAPHFRWATSAEYRLDRFQGTTALFSSDRPEKLETRSIPLTVRYFAPSGVFAELSGTYYDQEVSGGRFLDSEKDDFFLLDAAVGYRLKKQSGILSLEARNVLDQDFSFQDDNFRTSEDRGTYLVPERVIFGRITLNF
jgi:tetratricopeptide (TPR) repeat protein